MLLMGSGEEWLGRGGTMVWHLRGLYNSLSFKAKLQGITIYIYVTEFALVNKKKISISIGKMFFQLNQAIVQ